MVTYQLFNNLFCNRVKNMNGRFYSIKYVLLKVIYSRKKTHTTRMQQAIFQQDKKEWMVIIIQLNMYTEIHVLMKETHNLFCNSLKTWMVISIQIAMYNWKPSTYERKLTPHKISSKPICNNLFFNRIKVIGNYHSIKNVYWNLSTYERKLTPHVCFNLFCNSLKNMNGNYHSIETV